jgi:MFS family permease
MSEMDFRNSTGRVFYGWRVAVAGLVALAVTMGSLGGALPIFNKTLQEEMGWELIWIVAAFVAFLIGAGVCSPIVGILVERLGSRVVILAGTLVMAVCVLLLSGMQEIIHYISIMAVLGGSIAAVSIVPVQKLVTNWFESSRGFAMGLAMSGGPLGTAVMAIAIGLLMPAVGWRFTFLIYVALLLLVMLPLLALVIRNRPDEMGMSALGAGSLDADIDSYAAGAAEPAAEVGLLKTLLSPAFLFLILLVLLSSLGTGAPPVHFAFLAGDQGFDKLIQGVVVAFFAGGNIVGTLLFGWLSDRLSKRKVIGAVNLLGAVSVAAMLVYGQLWLLISAALLFGLCWGGLFALWPVFLSERFGTRNFATLMGIVSIAVIIGWALAPLLAAIEHDAAKGYTITFSVFAASLALSGLLILMFRGGKRGITKTA